MGGLKYPLPSSKFFRPLGIITTMKRTFKKFYSFSVNIFRLPTTLLLDFLLGQVFLKLIDKTTRMNLLELVLKFSQFIMLRIFVL